MAGGEFAAEEEERGEGEGEGEGMGDAGPGETEVLWSVVVPRSSILGSIFSPCRRFCSVVRMRARLVPLVMSVRRGTAWRMPRNFSWHSIITA